MSSPRYLTKSRFKLACECPTKLFYTGKEDLYANQKIDDPFLMALARGGFQVGELAKCYFPGGIEVRAPRGDYAEAVRQTNELLATENVTIFEAAIAFENFFIRADVLVKTGNRIELIEVKMKSYREGESLFFGRRGTSIDAKWKPYLYDIAFQKLVAESAFPDYTVSAFLMLTNKAAQCPSNDLNQKIRVKTDANDQKYAELVAPLTDEEINNPILCKILVDDACERIFTGTDTKDVDAKTFAERAAEFADYYQRDARIFTTIIGECRACEFRATLEEQGSGKLSGFRECWAEALQWTDADFLSPTIFDIWNFNHVRRETLLDQKRVKLSEFTADDINIKESDKPGMSASQRQWLQVQKLINDDNDYFFDIANLRSEMATWKFPLHFIDFETATPAIPFTKGRRPYEEIAFQFSHHTVDENGGVRHAGQYLTEMIGEFPNYEFIRALREELSGDDGTIFRYATHENTYMCAILRQLREDENDIPDRDDLCDFIKSVSKPTDKTLDKWEPGPRCMVDLLEMVLRFYYDPLTKGSNSIKQVLPAILNRSNFLKEKYSKPVYGTTIPSLNFPEGKIWVEFDGDTVVDPYAKLPKMFGADFIDRLADDDELKDGGAAMMAYARLQFEDMSIAEREDTRNALLRYCELDTLAMVMIYEGWREMVR